jgi:hypothetical protein
MDSANSFSDLLSIGDAVLDGGIDYGIPVEPVRDARVVAFEEILVDAVVVAKQFQGRFEALRGSVEALVVHAADFEDHPEVSGFGQKDVLVDKPVEVHLGVERPSLLVILEDAFEPPRWSMSWVS